MALAPAISGDANYLGRLGVLMRSSDGPELALLWGGVPNGLASSLSDLSKNRDFLEYYVLRSPGTIVELRPARYSF